MVNFDEAKHAAVQLWDSLYSMSDGLLWEEKTWVNQCAEWLLKVLNEEAKNLSGDFKLLDYACGNGVYFDHYTKVKVPNGVMSITGADVSRVAIKNAREKYSHITTELKENIFLPHEVGRCDYNVAICWSTLHHMDRGVLGRCIKEFYDCLREDGLLIVSGWGRKARRFTDGDGRSPVTQMQCWPIGTIESLLLRFFSVKCEHIAHQGEPNEAFEIFVCRKRKLSLLQRYENELVAYLHDVGQDISFFHLYKYQISQDLMSGEMDRSNSFAFYRDEGEMVEIFARFVEQLKEGCGDKAFFFTKDIYSMRQKKHLIAFYDKGASAQDLKVDDSGYSTFYDFRLLGHTPESNCTNTYNPLESMTIAELYEKISNAPIATTLVKKSTFKDDFAERFYYGLNQGRDIGVYFFVCSSDEERNTSIGDGGLVLYTKKRLSNEVVRKIDQLVSKWTATLTTKSLKDIFKAKSAQSAIASIMSRNGSHNIGSHVLAALSHNVGTMPDDRVLYQYIQHRMDYIATVTTELPSWAASTMFIGEMMRTFLSQHHLLEYIASSEGLKSYKFQDLNIDLRKQFETVQIHVSYGSSKSSLKPVFSFDGQGLERPIEKDVALAIPGGVVGQHAFFTIVENVIRNAAKHGWSSEAEDERKKKNLEIHIDVLDDTIKDHVTFCIWDNMSSVDIGCHQKERDDILRFIEKTEKGNGTENSNLKIEDALSAAQASILIKRYEEETSSGFSGEKILAKDGALPLHWRQQVLMDQRIIHPDGSLRRENWGLAEIKISAGYLQRRTVGEMGGLDVLQGEDYIVRAIALRNENDKKWHLGYEFKVSRPRKVLIVTANPPENISEWKYEGVHFLGLSKAKELLEKWRKGGKTDAFSAEYLVVESVGEVLGRANFSEAIKDLSAVPFPFRVLAGDHVSSGEDGLTIIPFIKMDDLRMDADWKCAKDIVSCVSETWMDYCCKRWDYDSASVRIDLNTSGNEGGAGQALISDADIWRLLFTEYFHSTLESFSDENCAEDIKRFRRCLLESRTRYKFFADDDDPIVIKQLTGEKLSIDYLDDNSIIARQFQYLLRPENEIVPGDFTADKIRHELKVVIGESVATDFAAKIQALYNSYLMDCRPDINQMIKHFKQAFQQLDVMLRKYEERIVTLPKAFSILKDAKGTGPEVAHKDRDKKDDKVIIYNRHHKVTEADLKNNKYLYVEPLSGSQSYLSRLSVYSRHDFMQSTGDQSLIRTQLIENALMRILIVDERVSRFLRSHDKSRLVFRAMNIWCLDETGKSTDGYLLQEADKAVGQLLVMTHNAEADKEKFTNFTSLLAASKKAIKEPKESGMKGQKGLFDILIIHQGVLDKWCKDAASASGMEEIIDKLKEVVDYVVITTGRGTPANIPPCSRILPFSTIESTLFKLYPEKMTLVDSIMNILPLGGIRK